jgi:hypothetical protein
VFSGRWIDESSARKACVSRVCPSCKLTLQGSANSQKKETQCPNHSLPVLHKYPCLYSIKPAVISRACIFVPNFVIRIVSGAFIWRKGVQPRSTIFAHPFALIPSPLLLPVSDRYLNTEKHLVISMVVALLLLAKTALATNSSSVEGWQLGNDDTRSSWDLVWGCVSTILACTWTALHVGVPPRNWSNFQINLRKLAAWFLMLMGPELVAWVAAQELWQARSTAAVCNAKQAAWNQATREPESWLQKPSLPLSQAPPDRESQPRSDHPKWTLAHCFCLAVRGVVIQTEDEWIYTIRPNQMEAFIDAGLVSCNDIRQREIDDRAKQIPWERPLRSYRVPGPWSTSLLERRITCPSRFSNSQPYPTWHAAFLFTCSTGTRRRT